MMIRVNVFFCFFVIFIFTSYTAVPAVYHL